MTKDEALIKIATVNAMDYEYQAWAREALAQPEQEQHPGRNIWIDGSAFEKAKKEPEQEPVAWISVKDALPKAVRGVSYKKSLTDIVLVRHSDRPDYPITAHAVVGEGLGVGIAIPTDGASEHSEIAWYSQCRDLKNPFDLKNHDYGRYLPKIFGTKITHWMPITTPPQRKPLTDEQIEDITADIHGLPIHSDDYAFARAIEAAHGIKSDTDGKE